MNDNIEHLAPFRWKVRLGQYLTSSTTNANYQVFKVLLLASENDGKENGALRDARDLLITQQQFEAFLTRHASQNSLVPEDNDAMRDSYLLLDEEMRSVGSLRIYFFHLNVL